MVGAGLTFDEVEGRLRAAGCVDAAGEARAFLGAAPDAVTLNRWIGRREHGEPHEWIVGVVDFGGLRLHIAPGVYVPRPHTERLAERAAALLPPGGSALDLCTGVGAIAAHLRARVPTATVIGIDCDERAAESARRNGVHAVVGDLADPLRAGIRFDVVTAVPPYVPTAAIDFLPIDVQRHEPEVALDGGVDGLDVARRVVEVAAQRLGPGGALLVEVGGDQAAPLTSVARGLGFVAVAPWTDADGDLRGLSARRPLRSG